MKVWLFFAGFAGLALAGCGQTDEAAPAAAPASQFSTGGSESPAPESGGLNLTTTKILCESGEGAFGRVAEPGKINPERPRGKPTPELALASINGVRADRYKAVNVDSSTVEFVREDQRYVIKMTKLPEGTWYEDARMYCMKSGSNPYPAPAP